MPFSLIKRYRLSLAAWVTKNSRIYSTGSMILSMHGCIAIAVQWAGQRTPELPLRYCALEPILPQHTVPVRLQLHCLVPQTNIASPQRTSHMCIQHIHFSTKMNLRRLSITDALGFTSMILSTVPCTIQYLHLAANVEVRGLFNQVRGQLGRYFKLRWTCCLKSSPPRRHWFTPK